MRALLVALVAALTATVAAALIGPRVADSDVVQAELRRVVEEAAGRDLGVRGRIGVDLLPRPRLSLGRVDFTGPPLAGEPVRVSADRLDLDISLLALLTGRLEVHRARVVRPLVRVSTATPGPLLSGGVQALNAVGLHGLEVVQIVDGRVERALSAEAPPILLFEGVDGSLRRDDLLRRVAVSLTGGTAGGPLRIEGEIGEGAGTAPTGVSFSLAHGADGHRARLEFRGFGSLGASTPSLRGQIDLDANEAVDVYHLAGALWPLHPPPRLPRATPILLDGQVELSEGTLRLSDVTARLGANTLAVEAEIGLSGPRPQLAVQLSASELTAEANTVEDLSTPAALATWATHVDGKIELRLGFIRWRDHPIRQLRAELLLGPEGVRVERLTASLPGTADLSVAGLLHAEPDGPHFAGSLALSAEDARETLAGLGLPMPAEGGLRGLQLHAGLELAPASLRLGNFALQVDGAQIGGSAALVAGLRPRLALSASADRLDLGTYAAWADDLRSPALRGWLTTVDAALDLSVARIGLGELWGEGLYVHATLDQGLVRLGELSLKDLAEARLHLTGSGDLPVDSFQLAGELEAERPARLLRAFGYDPPPTVTRFAPVHLSGTARGTRTATELDLALGAVGVSLQVGGSLGPWFDPTTGSLALDGKVAQLEDAVRNAGLVQGAVPALARPLHLTGRLERSAHGDDLTFDADAPPARISGKVATQAMPTARTVTGALTAPVLDRDLLQAAAQLAPPLLGYPSPAPLASWLGRLPELAVPIEGLRGLDIDLGLDAARIAGLPGEPPASARLRVVDGDVSLDHLQLPLAGGTLTGVVTLTDEHAFATAGVDLSLTAARAEQLLPALGAGALSGELALDAKLTGSGRSLPELVRTLEGEAGFSLRDGTLPGGSLSPGTAALPLRELGGELAVTQGAASSPPQGLELLLPEGEGVAEVRLDLASWMAEIGLSLWPLGTGDTKAVSRRFVGPPGRLRPVETVPEPALPAPAASSLDAADPVR